MTKDKIILLSLLEVSPPGREPQVRALKGKVDNPYAVAWASYGASKARKKKESAEGGPGSGIKGHKPLYTWGTAFKNGAARVKRVTKALNDRAYDPYERRPSRNQQPQKQATGQGSMPQALRGPEHEAELSYKKRKDLRKSSFAIPEERKFPIHDASHARNALARASGTKYEKRVKAAVHRKFPSIGKDSQSKTPMPKELMGSTERTMCSNRQILTGMLQESVRSYAFCERADVQRATETIEGPMVDCWLITEGLGNRANMHYYGPECLKQGAVLFEGKPCFIDHQARSESQDRPERTVRDKCGYFKNVMVGTSPDGKLGLKAELHFDLSEVGRYAYDKACTAIHYRDEFPGSNDEYVGLSIAADGKLQERTVQVGDEVLDVKYVTEFTAVGSVDVVTSPARGGRFVSVLKG